MSVLDVINDTCWGYSPVQKNAITGLRLNPFVMILRY